LAKINALAKFFCKKVVCDFEAVMLKVYSKFHGHPMVFLKVFCLMAIFLTPPSIFAENKNPKIVVIGAGLAGLTTAYRLQEKGMDVHVYEARNRVGGRILTVKIGDKVAELGGQNISDGGEAKNILRLIEECDLKLIRNKVSLNHSYFTGNKLIPIQELLRNKSFHPDEFRAQLNDLVKRSKNMHEVLNGLFEEEDPLYKTLAVRLAGYEGATIEKLSPIYAETLYHMLLGGVAAAYRDGGDEGYINLLSVKGGNALLTEKLARTLKEKLYLNKILKKVAKDLDDSFVLTFQDNQKIKADILVLAIPCSIYEEVAFEENVFPLKRLENIKQVQYGTNAKIMIPFSQSPLKSNGFFFNDRMGSFFDMNSNLLTLYYTGQASQFSVETILDTYKQDRPMIERGFGDACPPLIPPVYAKDQAFAFYEGPVGYSWPNDPYVKGSYSYIAPGQESLLTEIKEMDGEAVKTLFAPVNQKLYFVGEHTSVLIDAPGTMEAACESGERVARMILNLTDL
jgi:monoamine oxidase